MGRKDRPATIHDPEEARLRVDDREDTNDSMQEMDAMKEYGEPARMEVEIVGVVE